jgi:predicted nucleic acid binding AN1-type Zn finger protein
VLLLARSSVIATPKRISKSLLKQRKRRMKCSYCKKKSHLEFKCACEKVFCVACQLPEAHKCEAKRDAKIVLEKVVADKVAKI